MSDTTPGPDALQTAAELTGALRDMTAQLKAVSVRLAAAEKRQALAEKTARRMRHIITGLIISFCLDLVVTAGFGWNTVRVNQTQNASHADLISNCRQANTDRMQDAAIWDTFLGDIAPPQARTPKVNALLAGINARIEAKDRLKNCELVYRTK